jgi:hypothetical protein
VTSAAILDFRIFPVKSEEKQDILSPPLNES